MNLSKQVEHVPKLEAVGVTEFGPKQLTAEDLRALGTIVLTDSSVVDGYKFLQSVFTD